MSIYIDRKFLHLISPRLDKFKQKDQDLFAFRCPYCGDSSKNKNKTRGFVYKKNNDYFYLCHNCSFGTTFYKFLEFMDHHLAKEYALERFINNETTNHNYTKPIIKPSRPQFKQKDINLPSISSLPDEHYAKQYIISRKLPKSYHKDLFYAEDFKSFVIDMLPDYEKTLKENDPRIIIPFRDSNNKVMLFQGRSLTNNPLKYITVIINKEYPKIYGMDKLDCKQIIYILEAPFDSMFIKNAVAVADANLEFGLKCLDNVSAEKVLIPDVQPRNEHIVRNIEKWITLGYNVCLMPNTLKGKDINEFIQKGMSKPHIEQLIKENTYNGLRAKLEFQKWRLV